MMPHGCDELQPHRPGTPRRRTEQASRLGRWRAVMPAARDHARTAGKAQQPEITDSGCNTVGFGPNSGVGDSGRSRRPESRWVGRPFGDFRGAPLVLRLRQRIPFRDWRGDRHVLQIQRQYRRGGAAHEREASVARSRSAVAVLLVADVSPCVCGGLVHEIAEFSSTPVHGRRPVLPAEVGFGDHRQVREV